MEKIRLIDVIFEDFVNYKEPTMTLMFPFCNFKCDTENGTKLCQNRALAREDAKFVDIETLVLSYINNPLSKAIVMQGLEPFDSPQELLAFIEHLRAHSNDPVIIYTGYTEKEVKSFTYLYRKLKSLSNIIIKYGRFKPNQKPHLDPILGVELANDEQYAKQIS